MLKNNLPISSIISIGILSFSAFFILLFVARFKEVTTPSDDDYFLLIVGLSLFITGTAILLRKIWARTILAISILGLMLFLLYITFNNSARGLREMALYIISIGPGVFLILLLYNEKVSIEFGDKHTDEEFNDVLDHFE